MPELPEVEVVRRGLETARRRPRASPPSTSSTLARCAVTSPGADDFAAALTGRASPPPAVAASTSGCRSTTATPLLGHLGMSGQMLVQPPGRAAPSGTCGCASWLADGAGAAVRRPADVRRAVACRRVAPSCRPRSRTSPATRSTRSSTTRPSSAGSAPRAVGHQAHPARPGDHLRRRQHLRRRGALAARLHGDRPGRPAHRARRCASVLAGGARGDGRGAGARAARRSTRSTSTSTARAATSTGRWRSTARRAGPARGAARRSSACRFMNRSSYFCPRCQPTPASETLTRASDLRFRRPRRVASTGIDPASGP